MGPRPSRITDAGLIKFTALGHPRLACPGGYRLPKPRQIIDLLSAAAVTSALHVQQTASTAKDAGAG
jgi:hypothetical protein